MKTKIKLKLKKEWKLLNNGNVLYNGNNEYCELYNINIEIENVLLDKKDEKCSFEINNNKRGKILTVWQYNNNINAILNSDGSLCLMNNNIIKWCREEGLSLPLFVYLFDESEDELNELKELNFDIFHDFTFKKIIIILTKYGKLFGLSSINGNILWEINLLDNDDNESFNIVTMLSIKHHPSHLLVILTNKILNKSKIIKITNFNINNNKIPKINIKTVNYYILNAFITGYGSIIFI
eukprot:138662_1